MPKRPTRLAGSLMIAGAVLANAGFAVLGSRFDYPDVLEKPAADVLRTFHGDAAAIGSMFAVLAVASALMIPIAWRSRHLIAAERGRTRRVMVAAGIAAGVVQVIGLMRWPLLVPHLADVVTDPTATAVAKADAIDTFRTIHTYLGGLVGEAFGYALTAVWTAAMVRGLAHRPGRWFAPVGYAAATLIALGLLEPLGVAGAGLANFLGYIAWSLWMVGVGVFLLRGRSTRTSLTPAAAPSVPVAIAAHR